MHPSRRPCVAAALLALTLSASAADPPVLPPPHDPERILDGLRAFFKKAARPDGSFRPGIAPEYEGMSDSAYSAPPPPASAVVPQKTFGGPPPEEEKTRQFLLCRQA